MKTIKEAIRNYFRENASIIAGGLLMMNGNITSYHLQYMTK